MSNAPKHFTYPGDTSPSIRHSGGHVFVTQAWPVGLRGEWYLTVPSGFQTDGASVPRIFFPLISAWDLSFSAPIVHDVLYSSGGRPKHVYPASKVFSRKEADRIFRWLQEDEGVWWWRRWASWAAVRCFGFLAWRRTS